MNAGQMRVWWIPQLPGKAFHVRVKDQYEAAWLIAVLAKYDIFQFENKIKPDYCNAGGLEVCEDGEWTEWEGPNGEGVDALGSMGV